MYHFTWHVNSGTMLPEIIFNVHPSLLCADNTSGEPSKRNYTSATQGIPHGRLMEDDNDSRRKEDHPSGTTRAPLRGYHMGASRRMTMIAGALRAIQAELHERHAGDIVPLFEDSRLSTDIFCSLKGKNPSEANTSDNGLKLFKSWVVYIFWNMTWNGSKAFGKRNE